MHCFALEMEKKKKILRLKRLQIRVFNRAWQAKLDQKRAAEAEAEQAVRTTAADELGNWNAQRDVRLNAKKDKNRSEEQVLLETLESEIDGGSTWDRVTKLIDSTAEAADSGKVDVVRMRKLFIQLKNEPLEKTRGGDAGFAGSNPML